MRFLADRLQKQQTEIARLCARHNTENQEEIIEFATDLENKIREWRNQ